MHFKQIASDLIAWVGPHYPLCASHIIIDVVLETFALMITETSDAFWQNETEAKYMQQVV